MDPTHHTLFKVCSITLNEGIPVIGGVHGLEHKLVLLGLELHYRVRMPEKREDSAEHTLSTEHWEIVISTAKDSSYYESFTGDRDQFEKDMAIMKMAVST